MIDIATSIRPLNRNDNVFEEIEKYAKIIQESGVRNVNFNFKFIDSLLTKLPENYVGEKLRSIFDKYGLNVTATHAPYLNVLVFGKDKEEERELKEKISKSISISSLLGSKCIVAHSGISVDGSGDYDENQTRRDNMSFFMPLSAQAKSNDIRMAIENHVVENKSSRGSILEPSAIVLRDVCEDINSFLKDNVSGICFDVGHANISGEDVYQQLSECGDSLFTLHLHNNFGYNESSNVWSCDTHNSVLNGNISMSRVFEILKQMKFNDNVIVESVYKGAEGEIMKSIQQDNEALLDIYKKTYGKKKQEIVNELI